MKKSILNIAILYLLICVIFSCQDDEDDLKIPQANFEFDVSNNGYAPATVTFTNTSTGAESYHWIFGNGTASFNESPLPVEYKDPGEYLINLRAIAENGMQHEKSISIDLNRAITFSKLLGEPSKNEYAFSVVQTVEGGFAIVGEENGKALLIKTDTNGNIVSGFPKLFGRADAFTTGFSIIETNEGGFAFLGGTTSGTGYDVYLGKVDANGNMLGGFPKTFGGSSTDENGSSIVLTKEGGFAITGSSFDGSSRDVMLIKTDANGNLIEGFPKTFGSSTTHELASSIVETLDGGIAIAGTAHEASGDTDVLLIRTDSDGNLLEGFPKLLGNSTTKERTTSMTLTEEGGFAISGYITQERNNDLYLVKTDANGNLLGGFPKTFGEVGKNNVGTSMVLTADGGIAIVGETSSGGLSNKDVYLVKVDANGNLMSGFPKTLGEVGDYWENPRSIFLSNDGGLAIAGYIADGVLSGFQTDVYLLKTDANGNLFE